MRIALQKPRAAIESKETDSMAARLPESPARATNAAGVLRVVSVPIGNPDDITLRALRTLREADLIVAEDSRLALRLLHWHGIASPPKIVSLRPRHAEAALSALRSALRCGQNVALICDAGTPGIADPGLDFMRVAREVGALVSALPGPCAALAALTVSGLPTNQFLFGGFPPRACAARAAFFLALAREPRTTVLYEKAPYLSATLAELGRVCGPRRPAALACDLTRPTEQVWRGPLAELRASCEAILPRGEIVLILGGLPEKTGD